MKMKRIFRRNQIIITTLAIMIAAAGYLNYSGKKEVQNGEVFEAGATEISDEDILAENQVVSGQEKDVNPAEDVSSDMAA
ncbi:MAG: SpoIIIAH-like family protein, partial [Clostridium sp.]